ncbi:MAG TPA: ABC transporter ATP-binding protein [Pseudomonadales bacterium]|nr:ABC transporter ATP-binding protein [Pseudomonadales bacterium]
MSVAIRAENLSKKYILRHQPGKGRHRYVALRDVLAHRFTQLFKSSAQSNNGTHEEFWALKNVSFEIKPGEAVGIIGRNGAGKSTLLKLLSRITEPSEGQIELEGRIASLLEVGTGFHPELTGRENIFLNGAILGMTRAEIKRKFDEIVAFAEVEKFLDTPVKHFSSGMYTRLAFAVAAHLEPEILVVDEVLAVGDAAFQKKCLGKMQDVSKSEGRTVLFVSHNMEAIARLCTKCFYLAKGELQMTGAPSEAIKAYSEHSKQVSADVDLAKLPRAFESTAEAQLLRLRSLQNGQAAWCFEYGTPLEFSLEFSVSKPIDDPEIGYQLFSITGVQLASTTTFQSHRLGRLSSGKYSLKIKIQDLFLNPGTYTLGFSIGLGERNVDNVPGAAQIEILPTANSVEKRLDRIWAPLTPAAVFEINSI